MSIFVDSIELNKRRLQCYGCEHLRKSFKLFWITWFKNRRQCGICKCDINSKTIFKSASCPKKKW